MTSDHTSQTLRLRLATLRRALLWRAVFQNVLSSLGGLALITLLLAGWDWAFGLTESHAAVVLGAALLCTAVAMLAGHIRAILRVPSCVQLALAVEQQQPELMDAFVCAVGLEAEDRPLRSIEAALLSEMQERFAPNEGFWQAFRRRQLRLRPLVLFALALLLLLTAASNCRAVKKGVFGMSDLVRGTCSGLRLDPGDASVPPHSDMPIKALVQRWEEAAWIEYREGEDGELFRCPMTASRDAGQLFTFYDLTRDVRYRVGTASLRSRWQCVEVYEPPRCLEVQLSTQPLAYTGRAAQQVSAFQDLKVISGEAMLLRVRIPEGCQARLQAGEESLPLLPAGDGWQRIALVVTQTLPCQLFLTDAAGRNGNEAPFTVTAEPDLPPLIELRQPALDSQVKPGDSLRLELFATDDFGLAHLALHYSVNGTERRQLPLKQAAANANVELEWNVSHLWDLPALGLKDGDLLSGYVAVADNRTPEPQHARSEIFFVVVRPEPASVDGEGGQGQEQKADISDLLAESKRLLRASWDALLQDDSARERSRQELLRDLKQLELDVRSRFHELQEQSQDRMGEPMTSLFNRTSLELQEAAKLVERTLVEESIAAQERALAALTQIENEMVKNSMRSKKAKSGKEQSDGESDDEQQDQEQPKQAQDPNQQEKIDRLKQQREALQRLIARQDELNRDSSRPDAQGAPLADKQEQLHDDSSALRRDIQTQPEGKDAAEAMNRATREMDNGQRAFARDDLRTGGIHGTRSLAAMVSALRALEDALRHASANQIAQLAQRADELSAAQQDAAQASATAQQTPPADAAAKALRERQVELKQQSDELVRAIRQAADGLQDDFPEAAKALHAAAEQNRQRELPEHQQRAINALLYKRYERARKDQSDAANYLQALANDLQNAAASLPPVGEQDLREALQQLAEQAEKVNQAMQNDQQERAGQQIERARQDAAQTLQKLAAATKDQRLQQLSDDLRLPTGDASPSAAGAETLERLRAAATILSQQLEKMLVERKLSIRRQVSPPPAKYQRLVEEYFKSLGRE